MIGVFIQLNTHTHFRNTRPLGYVIQENGCWEWVGNRSYKGYGVVQREGRNWQAHRWYYTLWRGPIPAGLQLDHLCFNRACINPDHLEIVTNAENKRRGANRQDACRRYGHPYTPENTYRNPKGARVCRACKRIETIRYIQRIGIDRRRKIVRESYHRCKARRNQAVR